MVKDGKKGGVKRLVYVSSWALREGEALPSKGDLEGMRSYGESFDEKVYTSLYIYNFPFTLKLRADTLTQLSRLVRSSSAEMPPSTPSSTTSLSPRPSVGLPCLNLTA